jgi:hypothetical protein
MDWWGNPTSADTTKEDELRYLLLRQLMLAELDLEVVDSERASWDSVINGGTGTFSNERIC